MIRLAQDSLMPELDLRFAHAFDVRINFDKRWVIGPIPGGAKVGYTSVGEEPMEFDNVARRRRS